VSKCWKQEKTNWREIALFQPKPALSGCTGQCPVRQAGSGELAALGKELTAYDYNSLDCPVCTGLSSEPTVGRANGRLRDLRETCGQANGREGAPDCPVRQRLPGANGRLRQKRKEICTGLSGAPGDRRQELPSWNALNGS
jgi:hypothetical protein